MECNRCFCTSAAKLLCTQIACVDWIKKKPYKIYKKLHLAPRQGKRIKTLRNKKVAATNGKENKSVKNINLYSDDDNANMMVTRKSKSNATLKNKKLVRENMSSKGLHHKNHAVREDKASNFNETLFKKLVARESKANKIHLKKRNITRQRKIKNPEKINTYRSGNAKKKTRPLQDLPVGECLPGRVYKSGCKRCFCDDSKKAKCSLKAEACAGKNGGYKPINTPEDVRPPFDREELKKVKTLTYASDKCDPGFKYKVSCNLCVCTERGNLLCSKELCLSFEDINRVEAAEKSGEQCTQDPNPAIQGCIQCKCVNSKLSCVEISNCFADTRMKLSSGGKNDIKLKIDPIKEKCIPNGIYRDNCNRCYCQEDGTLRCTQKTCLVYSQAEELRQQLKQMMI